MANSIEGEVWEVDDPSYGTIGCNRRISQIYNRQVTHTTQGKVRMYYLEGEAYKDYAGVRGDPSN